jgi:hypothetical protein
MAARWPRMFTHTASVRCRMTYWKDSLLLSASDRGQFWMCSMNAWYVYFHSADQYKKLTFERRHNDELVTMTSSGLFDWCRWQAWRSLNESNSHKNPTAWYHETQWFCVHADRLATYAQRILNEIFLDAKNLHQIHRSFHLTNDRIWTSSLYDRSILWVVLVDATSDLVLAK